MIHAILFIVGCIIGICSAFFGYLDLIAARQKSKEANEISVRIHKEFCINAKAQLEDKDAEKILHLNTLTIHYLIEAVVCMLVTGFVLWWMNASGLVS